MKTLLSFGGFVVITLSLCIVGMVFLAFLWPHLTSGQVIGAGFGVWILMLSAKLIGSAEVS